MFVNQIPLAKAKGRERERAREREEEGRKREIETKKKEKWGSSILMKVCICMCIPYSFCSDVHICDTNDVQLNTSDCIIVTSSAIFKRDKKEMWISSSNKSRDIILELLTNWCVLLVVIVCSSLLFFFLYILLFFSIYATFDVCMCMCALCKFTLYTRLPYLLPTLSCRLLMLAAACFCRSLVRFDVYHIALRSVRSMSRIER